MAGAPKEPWVNIAFNDFCTAKRWTLIRPTLDDHGSRANIPAGRYADGCLKTNTRTFCQAT
jgi:hypothetical protein